MNTRKNLSSAHFSRVIYFIFANQKLHPVLENNSVENLMCISELLVKIYFKLIHLPLPGQLLSAPLKFTFDLPMTIKMSTRREFDNFYCSKQIYINSVLQTVTVAIIN